MDPKDLEALEQMLQDPQEREKMSPYQLALYSHFLKAYKNPKDNTFKHRYNNYYAPFLSGMYKSATKNDLIPNAYKQPSPYDNPQMARNKYNYNVHLNKLSSIDPHVTALSHGLGMIPATSEKLGLPGYMIGHAIKNVGPLAWHLLKQHFADRAAGREAAAAHYNQALNRYPVE
jgi:hypothetical protein